ncbi:hypothetical protein [Trichormus azollae]|uniref:hypothetical protein n=1 Tax=Trichormus azollae TaxID=1164 RepID=UPI00019587F6|nr:hypothetical protein [Trichormus azollae]
MASLLAILSPYPHASRQKLAKGAVHSEGPVYIQEDDSVMWSDAHGNRLLY